MTFWQGAVTFSQGVAAMRCGPMSFDAQHAVPCLENKRWKFSEYGLMEWQVHILRSGWRRRRSYYRLQ